MTYCTIRWCGKNSQQSNVKRDGITFHRYPTDPHLKEKWVYCTKRENWFPSNYSVVCSRHFTEDCFYTLGKRRRLYVTAIPTLHLPVLNTTATTVSTSGDSSTIPVPIPTPTQSSQDDPISMLKEIERKPSSSETPSQLHSTTKKRLCRQVLQLSNQVKTKNKKIKALQNQVRHYRKKVVTLKEMIKELVKKSLIELEDADTLNKIVKKE